MSDCHEFVLALEDHLGLHPGELPEAVPATLELHASNCPACAGRWREAARSRSLLAALRSQTSAAAMEDGYFWTRLQAALEAAPRRRLIPVGGRDLVLASTLFAVTLGSFLYNFRRIERPNADEAIVLDVPHLNPMHPSDDHVRPQLADVMLNLMNP